MLMSWYEHMSFSVILKWFLIFSSLGASIFVMGSDAFAANMNRVEALVQIVCPDGSGNVLSGSGTIIDPHGIVLTNRHVIEDKTGNIIRNCAIGMTENIHNPPSFKYRAEVKYYSNEDSIDAAILYMENPQNMVFPFVDVFSFDANHMQLGEGIEVLGYPSIGGSTLTYVTGVMSGFNDVFIKTTAPIEYGNSGGAAYTLGGEFIGIPTAVIAGRLNSIGLILNVNYIKSWLQSLLGDRYIESVTETSPPLKIEDITLPRDVTPPDTKSVSALAYKEYIEEIKHPSGPLSFSTYTDHDSPFFEWTGFTDENGVRGYYVYFGKDINATPVESGIFTQATQYSAQTEGPGVYYLKVQAQDTIGNISNSVYWEYYYKQFSASDDINMDARKRWVIENRPSKFLVYDFSSGYKGELLNIVYGTGPNDIKVDSNHLLIEWEGVRDKTLLKSVEVNFSDDRRPYHDLCKQLLYDKNNKAIYLDPNAEEYRVCAIQKEADQFSPVTGDYISATNLSLTNGYDFQIQFRDKDGHVIAAYHPFHLTSIKKRVYHESDLAYRLNGSILLQVESHGEGWYVFPDNRKRYYLGRPSDAFEVMRRLGLGATHEFITKNITFPSNVSGKILIDVEDKGKAYYIYPKDRRAYYLGRPDDAFRVMRELGLGITNDDLAKIQVGT